MTRAGIRREIEEDLHSPLRNFVFRVIRSDQPNTDRERGGREREKRSKNRDDGSRFLFVAVNFRGENWRVSAD